MGFLPRPEFTGSPPPFFFAQGITRNCGFYFSFPLSQARKVYKQERQTQSDRTRKERAFLRVHTIRSSAPGEIGGIFVTWLQESRHFSRMSSKNFVWGFQLHAVADFPFSIVQREKLTSACLGDEVTAVRLSVN